MATEGREPTVGYQQARTLLLVAGLGILLLTAAVMYARRVETVEVVAVVLFIPVFLGFVFWHLPGGLVAALAASAVYVAMRSPAIEQVGGGRFTGLIVSRAIAYFAFGAIGGIAIRQLQMSLTKLDLYDQIDDATGLYNARFFVHDTDLEMARSRRYQTLFSVGAVDLPDAALAPLGRRERVACLKELGRLLQGSVRTVDRAAHARDGHLHRIAVVLPETGPEGAKIFTDRLADRLCDFLLEKGAPILSDRVGRHALTFPNDEAALQKLRDDFARVDRGEHPEVPATPPAPPAPPAPAASS